MSEKSKAPAPRVVLGYTEREEAAYRKHIEKGEAGLTPGFAAQLYELYLNGLSLDQIVERHRGLRLGELVRAAKEGDWPKRRLDYQNELLDTVRARVQQVQAESIFATTQLVAVMNKRFSDKALKFLETGDEKALDDIKEWSLPQFKTLVELLMRLTGQGGEKKVHVQGKVEHKHEAPAAASDLPPAKPLLAGVTSPDDAAQVLAMLTVRKSDTQ
jgi:hypothetical protein